MVTCPGFITARVTTDTAQLEIHPFRGEWDTLGWLDTWYETFSGVDLLSSHVMLIFVIICYNIYIYTIICMGLFYLSSLLASNCSILALNQYLNPKSSIVQTRISCCWLLLYPPISPYIPVHHIIYTSLYPSLLVKSTFFGSTLAVWLTDADRGPSARLDFALSAVPGRDGFWSVPSYFFFSV